jgi:predicted phage tail protein
MVASTTQRGALNSATAVFDGTKRAAYNRAIKGIPDAAKLKFGEQLIPIVRDGKVTEGTTPGMTREAAEWASRRRIDVRTATREQLSNQGRRFSEFADKSMTFEQYFAKYLDRLYQKTPEALEALKASDPALAATMEKAVYKQIVLASAKSRWWVSGSSTVMRVAGPVALIVGAALTVDRIASAKDSDRAIVIVDEAASWTGSLGGAYVGGEAGGALGFAVAGPPGAFVGGVVGGIVGAVAGEAAMKKILYYPTEMLEQIMQAQQRQLDAARVMEQVFGPIKDPDLRRRLDDEDAMRAFFGG